MFQGNRGGLAQAISFNPTTSRLQLAKLDAKLTTLSKTQADYIGVPVEGPYKTGHYRY
ncbi:MAG: adenosylhomocysteinase [Chthonomonadaceae bacterium]|nr:adenosylhomocysteinase [Chthonomonadaceae bacterium]